MVRKRDRDARQYLAWNNSFRLILRDLGLERQAKPLPSLQEHLEREYGGAPA